MTIYLATEANRVHPPGTIPAPTEDRSSALSWLGEGTTPFPPALSRPRTKRARVKIGARPSFCYDFRQEHHGKSYGPP
jgi:hypothetical protein